MNKCINKYENKNKTNDEDFSVSIMKYQNVISNHPLDRLSATYQQVIDNSIQSFMPKIGLLILGTLLKMPIPY